MNWKTSEIKKLAEEAASSVAGLEFVVVTRDCGGDHDTTSVHIDMPHGNDAITICGFHSSECLIEKDDAVVETIEMRSFHADSRGGVQTDNEGLVLAAHRLTQKLKALGWSVVPNLGDYF